jgi:hypothetical protein
VKSAVGKPAVSGYGATYATGHARIFGPKPPRPTCNRCADPAACAAGCVRVVSEALARPGRRVSKKAAKKPAKKAAKTPAPNKGGRPAFEATAEHLRQIETASGYGLTEAAIARLLDIHPNTFAALKTRDERVSVALEKGKALAEHTVGQALFVRAKTGDIPAMIWWEKTRAGRTDKVVQEVTGGTNNTLRVVFEGDA